MLSGLTSRWTTPWSWTDLTAWRSCLEKARTALDSSEDVHGGSDAAAAPAAEETAAAAGENGVEGESAFVFPDEIGVRAGDAEEGATPRADLSLRFSVASESKEFSCPGPSSCAP